jgi:hypothetical protein
LSPQPGYPNHLHLLGIHHCALLRLRRPSAAAGLPQCCGRQHPLGGGWACLIHLFRFRALFDCAMDLDSLLSGLLSSDNQVPCCTQLADLGVLMRWWLHAFIFSFNSPICDPYRTGARVSRKKLMASRIWRVRLKILEPLFENFFGEKSSPSTSWIQSTSYVRIRLPLKTICKVRTPISKVMFPISNRGSRWLKVVPLSSTLSEFNLNLSQPEPFNVQQLREEQCYT